MLQCLPSHLHVCLAAPPQSIVNHDDRLVIVFTVCIVDICMISFPKIVLYIVLVSDLTFAAGSAAFPQVQCM